ncbi:hypothetical protein GCK72_020476 [Caenorhabditis remanei]|uniref:C-type lectin domain-containing protein n=1 Tax=Caenorhabditis remanei TaxID=31234 RepID=A0A6A5GHK5_CAERE|nr:hypothetical protein GCK72_020476 [Caenorhabditis remanei]KAF1753919.1 hypothetical protein GCK72_020476 [Caenorhabditis remanei]
MFLLGLLLLNLFGNLSAAGTGPTCPDGFTLLNDSKCVKLYETAMTYVKAVKTCRSIIKGDIVSVHKNTDNQALLNLINSHHSVRPIWLGLTCVTSNPNSCSWDDNSGAASYYNNFAKSNPNLSAGKNVYMLVSGSSTGKWISADGNLVSLSFVCETPSSLVPDDESCSPASPTTFLFAYSNDLNPTDVLEVWSHFDQHREEISNKSVVFANVRFDLRKAEDIFYHTNFSDVMDSVEAHLPDSDLGFTDVGTGSDILSIIQKFINDGQKAPICGSAMLILLKRYPNEQNIDDIVAKLRKHHIYIYVVTHEVPSGGLYSQTMYDIATRTNGYCSFGIDQNFLYAATNGGAYYSHYLFYSTNIPVSGKNGTVALPLMTVPDLETDYLIMTIQDHGPLTSFIRQEIDWNAVGTDLSGGEAENIWDFGWVKGNGTFYELSWQPSPNYVYNMTFSYAFTDRSSQVLQFRAFTEDENVINTWIPYDN